MTENDESPSLSEVNDLLKNGSQCLTLGNYEKALRHFNRACSLDPGNVACQHWRLRAEWLIQNSGDPWKTLADNHKPEKHERDSLSTTMAKGLRCWNPKFNRLRLLHLGYGLFLAELGEFEDSAREARWLFTNGYKEAAKQVRHKIQTCQQKS